MVLVTLPKVVLVMEFCGLVKLWTVAQLERIRTGHQRDVFPYGKGLEDRQVVLDISRAVKRVTAYVAQNTAIRHRACSCLGTARGLRETCGIKPLIRGANTMKHVEGGDEICILALPRSVDRARVGSDVERQTRIERDDGRDLPATDHGRCEASI